MHIEIDLGRLLKEKEKGKNLVYERCGLQRTRFNNCYRGKVSRVNPAILVKIYDCLGYTPNGISEIVKETAKDEQNTWRHVKLFIFFCACIPDKQN